MKLNYVISKPITYISNSVSQTILLKSPSSIKIYNIIDLLSLHKSYEHDNTFSYFLNLVISFVPSFIVFFCTFKLVFFPQIFQTANAATVV